MTREINYPIKYAVLELKERGGWAVHYEEITNGFIVSKCYVIGSEVVYNSDGTSTIKHHVAFPYEDIETFKASFRNRKINIGKENILHYDVNNKPWPIRIVSSIYDSYEEAKKDALDKNEDYKHNIIYNVPSPKGGLKLNWKEQYESLIKEFENNLELCNLFEQLVITETENMTVSKDISTDLEKLTIKILKPLKK